VSPRDLGPGDSRLLDNLLRRPSETWALDAATAARYRIPGFDHAGDVPAAPPAPGRAQGPQHAIAHSRRTAPTAVTQPQPSRYVTDHQANRSRRSNRTPALRDSKGQPWRVRLYADHPVLDAHCGMVGALPCRPIVASTRRCRLTCCRWLRAAQRACADTSRSTHGAPERRPGVRPRGVKASDRLVRRLCRW